MMSILPFITMLFTRPAFGREPDAQNFIKPPNVAGQFYPADPKQLSQNIERYLADADVKPFNHKVDAIIVPHAGHPYSGPVAAHAFKAVSQYPYRTIIVLAPTHYYQFKGVSIWPRGEFQTPLGSVKVDEGLAMRLINSHDDIGFAREVYEQEHSLEVELPFIQKVFPDAKIVPAINGRELGLPLIKHLAHELAAITEERDDVLIIVSTDQSHFHDDATARKLDLAGVAAIEKLDADEILKNNNKTMEVDGVFPVLTAIYYAQEKKLSHIDLLKYGNSGDVTGDRGRVVGYAAMAFYGDDEKEPNQMATTEDSDALTKEQKRQLINIARQTIEKYIRTGQAAEFQITDPRLLKTEGAFVTLHKKGQLRGCIGNIIGRGPLALTVRNMAIAAATQDPRFEAIQENELADIDVEVSVLSEPRQVTDVNKIEMGKHGVIVTRGGRGGVFLPQVADETGWDRDTFLSQLCAHKAGLPADCWKDPDTKVEIFTAQVFSEKDVR